MAATVYILCAITSVVVAILLARGYRASRSRLLLWSATCFAVLAVNNFLLVADRLIWTGVDLSLARGISGLVGLAVIVFGLVWEAR